MKQEKHISFTLCDVSSYFRQPAIPGREIVLAHARQVEK